MPGKLPYADEALSSWLSRRLGQMSISKAAFDELLRADYPEIALCLQEDPDFPRGTRWRRVLANLLKVPQSGFENVGHAQPLWTLRPGSRHSVCFDCLAEAPAPIEQYAREGWLQSWRTTCDRHFTPFVRVPAVGWGWAELRYSSRKTHGRMMRLPGDFAQANTRTWGGLHGFLREAVFTAERYIMSDLGDYLEHAREDQLNGAMLVWSDLLSCVSQSWLPFAAPAIASFGLPVTSIQTAHFRSPNVAPSITPLVEAKFLCTDDPAERRVCLVVAADAMYEISRVPLIGVKRQPATWGWPKLLQEIPSSALTWLGERAQRWPNVWRARASLWNHPRP